MDSRNTKNDTALLFPLEIKLNTEDCIFSKTFIVLGTAFGILLVWIGNIIFTYGLEGMFKGELGSLQAAGTLNTLGFASICLFLLGGGIANRNIDKYVRLLMILGGVILLWQTLTLNISGLLSSLGRIY